MAQVVRRLWGPRRGALVLAGGGEERRKRQQSGVRLRLGGSKQRAPLELPAGPFASTPFRPRRPGAAGSSPSLRTADWTSPFEEGAVCPPDHPGEGEGSGASPPRPAPPRPARCARGGRGRGRAPQPGPRRVCVPRAGSSLFTGESHPETQALFLSGLSQGEEWIKPPDRGEGGHSGAEWTRPRPAPGSDPRRPRAPCPRSGSAAASACRCSCPPPGPPPGGKVSGSREGPSQPRAGPAFPCTPCGRARLSWEDARLAPSLF